MKKALKIILLILLVIGAVLFRNIWESGAFKKIENSFSGVTTRIDGLAGAEDITVDQSTGIAFLSSDDRWVNNKGKELIKGAIYRLNLNDSVIQPVNLTVDFPEQDFRPHGLSLYQTPEGKKILFVINHRRSGNVVEIFEYRNDSLIRVDTVRHELLISPNDIVGVGARSFYFTNDHDTKPTMGRTIKDLLMIGSGNVGYYDGKDMTATGIEGINYANGINMSGDGKKLYVAATTGKKILIYNREISNGELKLSAELDTDTGVDNIELNSNGDLWIGCHPQMLKFLFHAKDETKLSPSEIIRLKNLGNDRFEQSTVYMNDGTEISASSVGAVYRDKLLIGPVFQRHMVLAEMK
ncbi:arylesterase [soil metagenome]